MRSNSITGAEAEARLRNRLEWLEALKERYDAVSSNKEEYAFQLISHMAVAIALSMVQLSYSNADICCHKDELKKVRKFLRKWSTAKAVKKYATKNQFIYYLLALILMYRANVLYKAVRKPLQKLKDRCGR